MLKFWYFLVLFSLAISIAGCVACSIYEKIGGIIYCAAVIIACIGLLIWSFKARKT